MTHDDRTDLSVFTRPQPGCTDTVLVFRQGVFIGRVCGHAVHDATGRLRSGDQFERFILAAVPR